MTKKNCMHVIEMIYYISLPRLEMAHAAGIQTQFMNLPAETFLIEENGRVSDRTIHALTRNFIEDENSVTPEECETKHSSEKEATSLCLSAITTDQPFPTNSASELSLHEDSNQHIMCVALEQPFNASNTSMAPIVIKSRKPRRKGDKPLVKLILSDSKQANCIPHGSVVEFGELSAEGSKKKSALESLKQVQSLFKFTPRVSSAVEISSSSKGLKGQKGNRHQSDYSGDVLVGESIPDRVFSGQEFWSGSVTLSTLLKESACATIANSEEVDASTDILHSSKDNVVDIIPVEQKVIKLKAKSKLKDEKKKLLAKSEIFIVPENIPAVPHSYEVATYDYSNTNNNYSDSSSSLQSRSQLGAQLNLSAPEETENPEKIKGKRKYTFQQPGVKRIPGNNCREKVTVTSVLQTESIPYVGGKESILSQLPLELVLVPIPLTRSDSLDTESNFPTDETAVPPDEEEESPRCYKTYEESDITADGVPIVKAIRNEKKEGNKKVLRGESKECSMTDVPGRHLLGPKMLAFIRAFPEGDVVGNDDVETSAAQRYRMENWLQQLKDDSINNGNKASSKSSVSLENEESSEMALLQKRSNEVNRIKVDLLKGIEIKLSKARSAGVRGLGGTSLPPHKPGMVQILLPYEVSHCIQLPAYPVTAFVLQVLISNWGQIEVYDVVVLAFFIITR